MINHIPKSIQVYSEKHLSIFLNVYATETICYITGDPNVKITLDKIIELPDDGNFGKFC